MRFRGELPFRGQMVWLTAAQGGRSSGPPPTPSDHDYAATAYVPPHGAVEGLASWIRRVDDRSAWRSPASAGWLAFGNTGLYRVQAGSIVVVTEGYRIVGYFHVDDVVDSAGRRG
ncbi:hypothetical protein AB0H76_19500 [Nocardia sp. NPDC050712]|uniref:hypothetical protein n=1 Tax=Nocardia sp. NPDC050712 TaxID=3155518 RepID=UPI0033D074CE